MEAAVEMVEPEDDAGRPLADLRAQLADTEAQITNLHTEATGKRFNKDQKERWAKLNEAKDDLEQTITELEIREEAILDLGKSGKVEASIDTFQTRRPGSPTSGNIYDLSEVRRSFDPSVEGRELKDRAKKALEIADFPHERADHLDVAGHIERKILKKEPEDGRFSRYLLATGSPVYQRAWTKSVAAGLRGVPPMLTPDEQAAMFQAEAAERAMSLTAASGGFAVPFVLDPTIIPTSSGAVNPYRQISNVQNITVDEWRGVSSDGVVAAFGAEAAPATDASPTLAQPTVSTEKAFAFVPYTIEIGQDWSGFAGEMAEMFQDAKDVLEATKFALGSGTNEPFGVVTGATTVFTASNTNALVVADIYGVHNALGPRFRSRAVWTINNAVADRIRQLDTAGGANLWIPNLAERSAAEVGSFTDARMAQNLLGHPAYEASAQSGTFTTGQIIGVLGDYGRYYKIVDRIGLTVETIPHLFGASQGNLPTGQRGLYAYWRVGAKVLSAAAFRALKLA